MKSPTPPADWEKRFDERWFARNGELKVETFLDIKSFIRSEITAAVEAERSKMAKEAVDSGRLVSTYKVMLGELAKPLIDEAVEARTEELSDWLQHKPECILSQWSAGEPTKDGGYRSKYAGKWCETRPADKTPKCNCGLSDALTTLQKEEHEKV